MPTAEAYAHKICANGPLAIRAVKESLHRTNGVPLTSAYEIDFELTKGVFASADAEEGPRAFAAFLGLTPKQNSSGGKPKLGRISKMGNRYLHKLLVVVAHAVLFHRKPRPLKLSCCPRTVAHITAAHGTNRRLDALSTP